jgi:cell division protein ZapE
VTLSERYHAEIAAHGYFADAAQRMAVAQLEKLALRLERARQRESSLWRRIRRALGAPLPPVTVRGLYLWGGVGRGKTLLMDLFAESLTVPVVRVHFHRFMHDVHARLNALRAQAQPEPLARIAADLAAERRVLCFDELYVSDIADAMLLAGLFEGLVAAGVTLVFTSNTPPAGLYRDGLQRSRFLPAIALLERVTTVLEVDGGTDYRLRELERAPLYLQADASSDAELERRFAAIAGAAGIRDGALQIEDRPIVLRRRHGGVAWFDFGALCEGPRGTPDYIEIARQFHTVLLSGVPRFDTAADNEARRFIALVDELYERGVKLIISAAAPADELYHGQRLQFEFRRTTSRLAQMQSHEYLIQPHRP